MDKDDTRSSSPETHSKETSAPSLQDGPFDRLKSWIGLGHTPSIRDDIADALAEGGARDDFSPREK